MLRGLVRKLASALVLGLAWRLLAAASDIDSLGRACGAGHQDACAQLVSIARTSIDGSWRRKAAERLIKERSRDCPIGAAERPTWPEGQPIHITSEYLFEHELDAGRQAEIVKAGDQFAAGALRSLGLEMVEDPDSAQAVVGFMVFGAARAWLFSRRVLDAPQERPDGGPAFLLYPEVVWKGVVTVRIAGQCVCSELLQEGSPRRETLYGTLPRNASEAPFRKDLRNALTPALIRLGKDLYGTAAIARMARNAEAVKVREEALAQLRDQAALAAIAKSDSDEYLRSVAVRKLTDQAALAEVAQSDPSPSVRLSAVQKLADPAVLSGIARSDQDPDVRRAAGSKLDKLCKAR